MRKEDEQVEINSTVEKSGGEIKIYSLIANDVFGINSVQLNLDGNSAMIIGPNQAGKTSIINALKITMGQIKNSDPKRKGERKGEIIADFGEFKVTRIWKDKGAPRWEVTTTDGAKYGNGQDVFNGFIDEITIQPDLIINKGGTERARLVCKAIGIDMEEFARQKAQVTDERKLINKMMKESESKMDVIGKPNKDVPAQEISISALTKELTELRGKQQARDKVETELSRLDENIERTIRDINELEKQLVAKRKNLTDYEAYRNRALEELEKCENFEYLIETVQGKLANAEKINNQVRARQRYEEAGKEYDKFKSQSEAKTDELKQMDADLREKLNNAGLVDGLVVEQEDIYLNNIKFTELSKFQQLDLAMQIGMNIKSKNSEGQYAKILCIDASPYDEENWKKIEDLAVAKGFTVIFEIARRIKRDVETGKLIVPDDINALQNIKKFYIEEGYAEELTINN